MAPRRRLWGLTLCLAGLLCAGAALAEGLCQGRDLFRSLAPQALAAIDEDARAMPFAGGTLFRLTRGDAPPSYVFGTLHLADPRVTGFGPAVLAALESVRTLALETVETEARLTQSIRRNPAAMRKALLARKDQRADALLAGKALAELKAMLAAAGMTAASALALKPSVLALLLDLPPCARAGAAHPYADARIAALGRARGIAVVGLETMIEQIGGLDGLRARCDACAKAVADWIARTPWIEHLARHPAKRSNTSVCLVFSPGCWARTPRRADGAGQNNRRTEPARRRGLRLRRLPRGRRRVFASGAARRSRLRMWRSCRNGSTGPLSRPLARTRHKPVGVQRFRHRHCCTKATVWRKRKRSLCVACFALAKHARLRD